MRMTTGARDDGDNDDDVAASATLHHRNLAARRATYAEAVRRGPAASKSAPAASKSALAPLVRTCASATRAPSRTADDVSCMADATAPAAAGTGLGDDHAEAQRREGCVRVPGHAEPRGTSHAPAATAPPSKGARQLAAKRRARMKRRASKRAANAAAAPALANAEPSEATAADAADVSDASPCTGPPEAMAPPPLPSFAAFQRVPADGADAVCLLLQPHYAHVANAAGAWLLLPIAEVVAAWPDCQAVRQRFGERVRFVATSCFQVDATATGRDEFGTACGMAFIRDERTGASGLVALRAQHDIHGNAVELRGAYEEWSDCGWDTPVVIQSERHHGLGAFGGEGAARADSSSSRDDAARSDAPTVVLGTEGLARAPDAAAMLWHALKPPRDAPRVRAPRPPLAPRRERASPEPSPAPELENAWHLEDSDSDSDDPWSDSECACWQGDVDSVLQALAATEPAPEEPHQEQDAWAEALQDSDSDLDALCIDMDSMCQQSDAPCALAGGATDPRPAEPYSEEDAAAEALQESDSDSDADVGSGIDWHQMQSDVASALEAFSAAATQAPAETARQWKDAWSEALEDSQSDTAAEAAPTQDGGACAATDCSADDDACSEASDDVADVIAGVLGDALDDGAHCSVAAVAHLDTAPDADVSPLRADGRASGRTLLHEHDGASPQADSHDEHSASDADWERCSQGSEDADTAMDDVLCRALGLGAEAGDVLAASTAPLPQHPWPHCDEGDVCWRQTRDDAERVVGAALTDALGLGGMWGG